MGARKGRYGVVRVRVTVGVFGLMVGSCAVG